MNINYPVPTYLANHKTEIAVCLKKEMPSIIEKQKWLDHFKGNAALIQNINYIFNQYGKTAKSVNVELTRSDLIVLAKTALAGKWEDIRKFYIATMMWGWEFNQLRGCAYVELGTLDPNFQNVLTTTIKLLTCNKVKGAYEQFHLRGCKSAYFTKLFYFLGRAIQLKPLPLILDKQVIKSLYLLDTWEGSQLVGNFANANISPGKKSINITIKEDAAGYLRYLHAMDHWGTVIGCAPDNIEFFLYRLNIANKNTTIATKRNVTSTKIGGFNMVNNPMQITISLSQERVNQLTAIGQSVVKTPEIIASEIIEAVLNVVQPDGGLAGTVPGIATVPTQSVTIKARINWPSILKKDEAKYLTCRPWPDTEIIITTKQADNVPIFQQYKKNKQRAHIPLQITIGNTTYAGKVHYYGDTNRCGFISPTLDLNNQKTNLKTVMPKAGFKKGPINLKFIGYHVKIFQ